MLAALLTLALLLGIFRLLAPSASRRVRGFYPRADRGLDRFISGQTERRGAVLAALAAANLSSEFTGAGGAAGDVILVGVLAAVAFRLWPLPTGVTLGLFGTLAAVAAALGDSCAGVSPGRRALTIVVVLMGLATFGMLRLLFSGAGVGRGEVSALALFGIVQLGTFVAAPFGLALTELTGFGDSLAAVVMLYGLVVVAAALLPDFTASVIGIALLAATLSADTVVGDTCTGRHGVVLAVLVGFAITWWLAGLLTGRPR